MNDTWVSIERLYTSLRIILSPPEVFVLPPMYVRFIRSISAYIADLLSCLSSRKKSRAIVLNVTPRKYVALMIFNKHYLWNIYLNPSKNWKKKFFLAKNSLLMDLLVGYTDADHIQDEYNKFLLSSRFAVISWDFPGLYASQKI